MKESPPVETLLVEDNETDAELAICASSCSTWNGVNSYVVKPLDFDQFVAVVAKVGLYWAVVNKVVADARSPARDR